MLHKACGSEKAQACLLAPKGLIQIVLRHRHQKRAAQGSTVATTRHPRVCTEDAGILCGKAMFQGINSRCIKDLKYRISGLQAR